MSSMAGKSGCRTMPAAVVGACWVAVLILALASINDISAQKIPTEINPCSDLESKHDLLEFRSHERVSLCCVVKEPTCDRNSSNETSTLTLFPGDVTVPVAEGNEAKGLLEVGEPISQQHRQEQFEMQQVDACQVKLLIKNPQPGILKLHCEWNGELAMERDVYFVAEPMEPNITKVVTSPSKRITLTFDRGEAYPGYQDSYTVTMVDALRRRNVTLCHSGANASSADALCKPGERMCVCHYEETDRSHKRIGVYDVAFVVAVSRQGLYQVETRSSVKLLKHVIPEPVENYGIERDSPHQVKLKFCLDSGTALVARFLNIIGPPIKCWMILDRTEGIQETVTLVVEPGMKRTCFRVTFPDLTPHTRYNLTVFAVGGGGEGQRVHMTFLTDKTVPLQSPVLHEHSFLRGTSRDDDGAFMPYLLILWQPLAHAVRGGATVTYDLEVLEDDGSVRRTTHISDTYKLIRYSISPGRLLVKLWARNEMGQSENFSTLEIRALSEIKPVPFQAEFSTDKLHLHFKPSVLKRSLRQMVVHLCKSSIRVGETRLCTDSLQTLPLADYGRSNKTTLSKTSVTGHRVIQSEIPILYSLIDEEGYYAMLNLTVMASVKTTVPFAPHWVGSEGEVSVNLEDDGATTDQSNTVRSSSVVNIIKRSALLEHLVPARGSSSARGDAENDKNHVAIEKRDTSATMQHQGHRGRLLMSLLDPDPMSEGSSDNVGQNSTRADRSGATEESDSTDEFSWVFVSQQAQDGTWGGMTPAQCYFTENSDLVKLTLSQGENQDEPGKQDAPVLRWLQECDGGTPRQFLADVYKVYVAQDETCKQNVSHVKDVPNTIFEPLLLQLPDGWPFACVKTHRSPSADNPEGFTTLPITKSIDRPIFKDGSSDTNGLVSGIIVAACVVFAVVTLYLAFRIHRRYKSGKERAHEIERLFDEEEEDNSKREDKNSVAGSECLPPVSTPSRAWPSQQSGLTFGGDSGVELPVGSNNGSSGSTSTRKDPTSQETSLVSLSINSSGGSMRSQHEQSSSHSQETSAVTYSSGASCNTIEGADWVKSVNS